MHLSEVPQAYPHPSHQIHRMNRKPTRRPLRLALAMGIVSHAAIPSLHAADIYWDGGNGTWADVANWSTVSGATTPDPLAVPGASDTAIFNTTSGGTNG